ncbi:hypothetical protein GUJ93_ZPchr0015g6748 [Zizania palustris]|uniref:Uncharacterized protein n=1 Tax=Zizania palustris TaxID=103762 RepID=A0A8J5TDD7_ZIZPA|nr:hypothetical protein GUJ93_ZPchr0015g6748 [Zizania palustris]
MLYLLVIVYPAFSWDMDLMHKEFGKMELVTLRCVRPGGFVVELRAMMRKIDYLLQLEFEWIEFAVGADRRWRVTVMIPDGRTDLPTLEKRSSVTARKSVPLLQEQQRFVVEIPEETRECTTIAPTPVPASAPQRDQPLGEDSEEPMEEEFFEESRTEGPLIGYTPAP